MRCELYGVRQEVQYELAVALLIAEYRQEVILV